MIEELDCNKERIDDLKQNPCLIDLEEQEKEYEEIRREVGRVEKAINQTSANFLQINNYYYEMKIMI